MSLTDRLYAVAKPIWDGYLEQPFVKELGEGTLREDRFRFYMVQDYRYLLQYAKVFAMGVVKTEDEALMTRFSYMVHDTLDGEMNIHKAYMSRLGITEQEVATTKSTLTNQSYTSYMLDEAYKGRHSGNSGGGAFLRMELSDDWGAPSACTGGIGASFVRRMGARLLQ